MIKYDLFTSKVVPFWSIFSLRYYWNWQRVWNLLLKSDSRGKHWFLYSLDRCPLLNSLTLIGLFITINNWCGIRIRFVHFPCVYYTDLVAFTAENSRADVHIFGLFLHPGLFRSVVKLDHWWRSCMNQVFVNLSWLGRSLSGLIIISHRINPRDTFKLVDTLAFKIFVNSWGT